MGRGKQEHATGQVSEKKIHTTDYFSKEALEQEAKADVCCTYGSWRNTKLGCLILATLGAAGCFGVHIYLSVLTGGLFFFSVPAVALSFISSTFGICASYGRKKINSLRTLQNQLREEVDRFHEENKNLVKSIDKLEEEVDRLKPIERKLNATVGRNGDDVDELVDLVAQNRETIDQMKVLLKAEVVEDMLSLVLDSDTDGDFHISGDEVDILLLRLSVIDGVESINEEKVKHLVAERNGSLSAVLRLVRYILQEEDDGDDPIVKIDPMSRRRKQHPEMPALKASDDETSSVSSDDSNMWQRRPDEKADIDEEKAEGGQQMESQELGTSKEEEGSHEEGVEVPHPHYTSDNES